MCLGIAASVSLGLKQHVLFLDSTGGFTASRLYQMLQAQTEDEEEQASSPGAAPCACSKTHFALACKKPQRWFVFPALPLSSWAFLSPSPSFHGSVGALLRTDTAFCCFSWEEGGSCWTCRTWLPDLSPCCFSHQCNRGSGVIGVEADVEG